MRDHRMPVLRAIALVVMAVWGATGHAAGLGSVRVQSSLGAPLRLSIPVLGSDTGNFAASCVKARLEHTDGMFIVGAQVAFSRVNQATIIHLATHQPINEPAIAVKVDVTCGTPIQRIYHVLLDPLVILPQLAQSGTATAPAQSARSALQPLPMIAPAIASASQRDKRQRTSRRTGPALDTVTSLTTVTLAPAKTVAKASSARRAPKMVERSVLKLSGDEIAVDAGATFSPTLKLSDTLSDSRDYGDVQQAAELRAAYARFAAVMRGEDPVQSGELQIQALQSRLQALEQQTALLRQQSADQRQADLAAMANMRKEMFSVGWIIGLGGLLLAALAAIGWLIRRSSDHFGRRPAAIWEETALQHDSEPNGWEETLSPIKIGKAATQKSALHDEPANTDWEKGVPFDNTLAVDWAAQQATLQNNTLQPLSPVSNSHVGSIARQGHDTPQAAQPAPIVASRSAQTAELQRILAGAPIADEFLSAADLSVKAGAAAAAPQATALAENNSAGSGGAPAGHPGDLHVLHVEELADLMQEAEFWMLLNDSDKAIEILEPYADVKDPVTPVPWIYLLDLYRVVGSQSKYEALGMRIKQMFNTSVPAWEDEPNYASARSLEDYPHVIEAIQDLWEGEYIVSYLESLLFDDRNGARAGFDLAVYREIIHLIGIAQDPDMPKRRSHLSFGKSQPRLISQQVTSQAGQPGNTAGAAAKAAIAEEMDVFDRAMSQQATAKQVLPKLASPKAQMSRPSALPVSPRPQLSSTPAPDKDLAANLVIDRAVPIAATTAPSAKAAVLAQPEQPAPANIAPKPDAPTIEETIKAKRAAFAIQQKVVEVAAGADTAEADENDHFADMTRKINLAVAYQEIGEHVGARVLLEEVIQGGTPIQADKAKAMLKKLLKEIDWQ